MPNDQEHLHEVRKPNDLCLLTNLLLAGLLVHYIAEHHENLGNVAVFIEVNGAEAGADVDAEVFSSGDERLILKSGASTSPPLALPARVTPGKKDVRVQSGHFVLKLECMSGQSKSSMTTNGDCLANGLLDSAQIRNMHPTTFICASCSLPLVQASRLSRYDDLPSEHWAELIEAWMCHSDQKMTDRIALYAKGLWPVPGQALVGGSYILFDSTSLVTSSIRPIERTQVSNNIGALFGTRRRPSLAPTHQRLIFAYRTPVRHNGRSPRRFRLVKPTWWLCRRYQQASAFG